MGSDWEGCQNREADAGLKADETAGSETTGWAKVRDGHDTSS